MLEAREEAAIIPYCSVLEFFHPFLVSVLFAGTALTWNGVFLRNIFPLVSVLF